MTPPIDVRELTDRDLREAIKLGNLNFDNLRPEFQAAFRRRLDELEAEYLRRGL